MPYAPSPQSKDKRFWWVDVAFYLAITLLVAVVFIYLIFLLRNSILRADILNAKTALVTVGTSQQKRQEEEVLKYQKKFRDFASLLENHQFASNAFAFMEDLTMPNIWFKQFGMDRKNATVQLSGESDDLDAFSRQVAVFEKNEYVKNIGGINSSLGTAAKTSFNLNLSLTDKIFTYLPSDFITEEEPVEEGPSETEPEEPEKDESSQSQEKEPESEPEEPQPSAENFIISFRLVLDPDVRGIINQEENAILLNVPHGTDITSLRSSIVASPGSVISPAPGTAQDYTNPVIYTLTGADESVRIYEARVVVAPAPQPQVVAKTNNTMQGVLILILIFSIVAVAGAILIYVFLRSRKKQPFER